MTNNYIQPRKAATFFFYVLGISIIVFLVARLPFNDLLKVISTIGIEALWLVVFPMIWVIPYSMTLRVLLENTITFKQALFTQISGDAFNSITPLVGMGGEPYKAKSLSRSRYRTEPTAACTIRCHLHRYGCRLMFVLF